jgi:phosphatidylethanolamine-binding protein (PEBP) family uncharacterized protein
MATTAAPLNVSTQPSATTLSEETAAAQPFETPTLEPTLNPTDTPSAQPPTATPTPSRISVTSPAFESGGIIPERHARSGENLSPPLTWSDPSSGTESFTIQFVGGPVSDGDGTWILWAVYNLPGDISGLPEGVLPNVEGLLETDGRHLENSYLELAYSGPPTHPLETRRFYMRPYAPNTMLDPADIEEAAATVNTWIAGTELIMLKAMEGHILAEGQLSGKYKGDSPVN